jgi:hypothetical protein
MSPFKYTDVREFGDSCVVFDSSADWRNVYSSIVPLFQSVEEKQSGELLFLDVGLQM